MGLTVKPKPPGVGKQGTFVSRHHFPSSSEKMMFTQDMTRLTPRGTFSPNVYYIPYRSIAQEGATH